MNDLSSLKCKQKLCGFPEDKYSNRSKVLIHKFYKTCLKWSLKRKIQSANRNSWTANPNPVHSVTCFGAAKLLLKKQRFISRDSFDEELWITTNLVNNKVVALSGACTDK